MSVFPFWQIHAASPRRRGDVVTAIFVCFVLATSTPPPRTTRGVRYPTKNQSIRWTGKSTAINVTQLMSHRDCRILANDINLPHLRCISRVPNRDSRAYTSSSLLAYTRRSVAALTLFLPDVCQKACVARSWVRLKFHLARLDSIRHIRRVEPMHFGCVELVEQHSSTRSTRRARLARLARQSRTCRVESSRAKWNLSLSEWVDFNAPLDTI